MFSDYGCPVGIFRNTYFTKRCVQEKQNFVILYQLVYTTVPTSGAKLLQLLEVQHYLIRHTTNVGI